MEGNMGTVNGKSVILTGGAGEIAREVAAQFLTGGAQVLLVDVNETALQRAVASLGGSSVAYCVADVTSEVETITYVRKALDTFGRLDVLVANAGVEGIVAPVSDYDADAFRRVLEINVVGVFLGIKHAFPALAAQGGGSIVITSSVAGVTGGPGLSAYTASKHAVIGLMRSTAKEGSPLNIRVNTVNPSPIEGRMMESLERGSMPDEPGAMRQALIQSIPMGRYGVPADVANLILFLASEESRFLNGGVYMVDGGMTA
jgi:NAD(P)-dependent dehydrogenase (short-subunit alcohol dehydrogenase family)